MDINWINVYSSFNLQKVELLKHILQENDIDAVVMNRQDSTYPVIGEIALYVNRDNVIPAKKIIENTDL